MASNSKLFVLLLSVAAAALVVVAVGAVVGGGDQEDQYAAGAGCDPPGVRARCCHQLREVAPYCRCEALRAMAEVLVEEDEAPPRCKMSAMAAIAAGLPGRDKCDLETCAAGARDDGESRLCSKILIN